LIQKQKQIICFDGSHSPPAISGRKVHVVYDTIDDEDVFRLSRLKHRGIGIKSLFLTFDPNATVPFD
jgi:hypothetical protein